MRIIHTSDWHLGKTLEGYSRIQEQEKFVEEFIEIVENKNPDMIIISGDIYDSSNPSAKAENLFYKSIKQISHGGKRIVLIIAGNHDSPERLEAINPLVYKQGTIILGTPKSSSKKGNCGKHKILDTGEGYVELEINGEKTVILTMPYPSEKRLEEVLTDKFEEEERQKSYSEKVGEIFNNLSHKYRDDTINLAVSHIFLWGGESTDSERPIQLGGSFAVELDKLPKKAQYIALGHLHKSQKFNVNNAPVIYSGSPIQYSKSERNNINCVYCVDLKAGEKAKVERILLRNYKPIELWQCNSVEEAIEKCKENQGRQSWVYIEIKTDRVLLQEEIKEMKRLKEDIIEIKPLIDEQDNDIEYDNLTEKSMEEVFIEFYRRENNSEPSKEILDLFLKISNDKEEGEKEDETKESQNKGVK